MFHKKWSSQGEHLPLESVLLRVAQWSDRHSGGTITVIKEVMVFPCLTFERKIQTRVWMTCNLVGFQWHCFSLLPGHGDAGLPVPVRSYREKILFQRCCHFNSWKLEDKTWLWEAKTRNHQKCENKFSLADFLQQFSFCFRFFVGGEVV